MLTIDQLNEIRDRVRKELQVRDPQERILVSVGTIGLAAGARQVMAAAMDEISHLGLQLVVCGEDGADKPDQLPTVRVLTAAGQAKAYYSRVTPSQVREIVRGLSGHYGTVADTN